MERIEVVFRYDWERIDRKIMTLFSRKFIDQMMERHGIRTVKVNQLLWLLRGQPMIFDPEERKIVIDLSAPWQDVRERLNRENAFGLDLTLEEAWYFVFFHELCHSDPNKSEYDCNAYARQRIIEQRKERFIDRA